MTRLGVAMGLKIEGDADETQESVSKLADEAASRGPEGLDALLNQLTDEQLEYFIRDAAHAGAMAAAWGLMGVHVRTQRKALMDIPAEKLAVC
jgi:hypothetical protein